MVLEVSNPTTFPADVKIYSEVSAEARKTPLILSSDRIETIRLNPGELKTVLL